MTESESATVNFDSIAKEKSKNSRNDAKLSAHVTGYFRETSVHGFRYVVEGTSWTERVAWVFAISLAFAVALHLVLSALQEARTNPVATSIDIRPIGQVRFPAVTVAAGGEDPVLPSYRIVMDALNTIMFDCNENMLLSKEKCLEQTKQVREDFAPLIRNTVRTVHEQWKRIIAEDKGNVNFRDWPFEPRRLQMEEYDPRKLLRVFCKLNGTLNNFDEEQLIDFLSKLFLMPNREMYQVRTFEYVRNSLWPEHLRKMEEEVDISERCSWDDLGSDEVKVLFRTLATLGVTSRPLRQSVDVHGHHVGLGLGDLLAYSFYSTRKEGYFNNFGYLNAEINPNTEKANSSTLPDQLLQNFLNNSEISAVDLINAMSNDFLSLVPKPLTSILDYNDFEGSVLDGKMDCEFSQYLRQAIYPDMHKTNINYADDIERLLQHTNYTRRCHLRPGKYRKTHCRHSDPMVTSCYYGDDEGGASAYKICDVFQPTFSAKGLAYTFNSGRVKDLFEMTEATSAMFDEILDLSLEEDDLEDLAKVEMGSQSKSLRFHLRQTFLDVLMNAKSYFWLSVHSPGDIATDFIKLSPGYSYEITVTPSMVTSDDALAEMPLEDRKCKTHKETNSSIFRKYTYSSCLTECKLRRAHSQRWTDPGCLPWDLPQVEPVTVCAMADKQRARRVMSMDANSYWMLDDCDCLPDCNVTTYSYSVKKEPINVQRRLLSTQGCEEISVIYLHPLLAFLSDPTSVGPSHHGEWNEACAREARHQTQVTVKMAGSTVPNIVRMRRVTFTDQMANLGGVIGLFTGMSFLSLMELIVWICRGGSAASRAIRDR